MNNFLHRIQFLVVLTGLMMVNANAQEFFGAGNTGQIQVSSSSQMQGTDHENTINGSGMDAELIEVSRFLSQASFGYRREDIEAIAQQGIEAWMDEQLNMQPNLLTEDMWANWQRILDVRNDQFNNYLADIIMYRQMSASIINSDSIAPPLTQEEVEEHRIYYEEDVYGPYGLHFNNIWWQNAMTKEDQLRQRVAFALSQIFVVSSNSDLYDHADALTFYYDILLNHAFGNFRDIIEEVTYSPAMGFYLSHLNNSKAIPEENIHPDENYAREIMQLFTIGLYELNNDGTRKQDNNGYDIPTYSNADIKELARVFTGLGPSALDARMVESGAIYWTDEPYFGLGLYGMSKQDPLTMYEEYHDSGSKSLLKGLEIPAGQDGDEDISMALDFLFNHANTGPFICRQLIQRLVKSNPSPDYINRVANAFNDNGQGVRGDMSAVVKAILLDEEARSCEDMMAFENGKLSEPILRHLFISKMADLRPYKYYEYVTFTSYDSAGVQYHLFDDYVDPATTELDYWHNGFGIYDVIKQYPLVSPTVFNFYLPDHKPVGALTNNDLYGPEYKIHDTSTAINYINMVWENVGNPWWNYLWWNWNERFTQFEPVYERYGDILADDLEKFIHHIDIEFTQGQMSEELKQNLRNFSSEVPDWVEDFRVAKYMIYLVMISPDFTIEK